MIEQVFSISDVPRIFALAFVELALSADNALMITLLSRSLPEHLRSRALWIGASSAIVLRAASLLRVSLLFEYLWLQWIGAGYLLYVAIRHFLPKKEGSSIKPPASFWRTVVLIEFYDLLFSLDSVIAGVAFINADLSKLWVVYLGGLIGLIAIRFAAHLFDKLITLFPRLETSAYLMIAVIGLHLIVHFPSPLFWTLLGLLFLLGFLKPKAVQ